jgi:hypothetical protein
MADAHGEVVGLEQELKQAFDGVHEALQRASDATQALSALAQRVRDIGEVFDQIEAAVQEGRRQIAGASAAIGATQPAAFARPTLVVPQPEPAPAPTKVETAVHAPAPEPMLAPESTHGDASALTQMVQQSDELLSFRLEFESRPGPLDLRAVDAAISEQPSVRDIALLDYDGHKATLKVWIEGDASPALIQAAIREHAPALFSGENEVSVVALEDAAA